MTSPVSLILVCLASLLTTGCGELKPYAASDAYSSASNAYLSQGELSSLTKTAMHGDGYAAERIAGYYFFFKNDLSEGLRWLDIAARNGNEHARQVAKSIRRSAQR